MHRAPFSECRPTRISYYSAHTRNCNRLGRTIGICNRRKKTTARANQRSPFPMPSVSLSHHQLRCLQSPSFCSRRGDYSVISSHHNRLVWWKSPLMLFLQINIALDGGRPLGPLLLDLAVLLLDISMGVRALEPSAVQEFHFPG